MHEVSLGITLRDYLTGEHIDQTTYEDLRQALALMLVEELHYPASQLRPKVGVHFPVAAPPVQGKEQHETIEYCRTVDIVAYTEQMQPLMLVLFCPGQINTYRREALAAARLMQGGPVPLIVITDTREAMLLATQTDTLLAEGIRAIPEYAQMCALAAKHPALPLDETRADRERRILHTYSEFIKTCCDESVCTL